MNSQVLVVDYGLGNLFSVRRAFESQGANVAVSGDPNLIPKADRLVLPGVGAFRDGMAELRNRQLVEAILEFVRLGRPFLGICLGMQMMFDRSHEFGIFEGLGIIKGDVKKIEGALFQNEPLKVPHIGWSPLLRNQLARPWGESLLEDFEEGTAAYFLHSYAADAKNPEDVLAYTYYGNQKIVAVVSVENIYGCQFHPERSGPAGLKIINGFMRL